MTRILAVGTHGTDDPTKASLPFITAAGAVGAGEEVAIVLIAEAANLAKSSVADSVRGIGFPPLAETIEQVMAANVPVYI